jgi:uncharacterized protein
MGSTFPLPVQIELPNGDILRGDLVPGTDRAIVYVHGFGSHRGGEKALALATECARRGWTYAAFDFRGHGASTGTMRDLTVSRLLEDLSAIRDFLAVHGHPRLGLVGSSMGGFASAWFALDHPETIFGCVLLAPAFRFLERRAADLTATELEDWRRTGVRRVKNDWVDTEIGYGLLEERAKFHPDDLARRWRTPLLIFHGMADDVVPVADSLAFVAATTYPDVALRPLKGGDHRLTTFKDEIAVEACRLFDRVWATGQSFRTSSPDRSQSE